MTEDKDKKKPEDLSKVILEFKTKELAKERKEEEPTKEDKKDE